MNAATERTGYRTGRRYAWLVTLGQSGRFGTICGDYKGGIAVMPLRRGRRGQWRSYSPEASAYQALAVGCSQAR